MTTGNTGPFFCRFCGRKIEKDTFFCSSLCAQNFGIMAAKKNLCTTASYEMAVYHANFADHSS
jgi:predicted nucleic acid-binding Zn ribbon protein